MREGQKVLVNFAFGKVYKNKRKFNTLTGKYIAKFHKIYEFDIENIDKSFYEKNKSILDIKKGVGLWLWKPYFLNKVFESLTEGDYLFHCDSASFFIKNIVPLVQAMNIAQSNTMFFNLPVIEKSWTSPFVLNQLNVDQNDRNSNHITASFFILKKDSSTEALLKEWLHLCQIKELIEGNVSEQDRQLDYFKDHRYDQSLLSILVKKRGIMLFRDPSQYGEFPEMYRGHSDLQIHLHNNSDYPTSILLLRTSSWYLEYSKYLLKKIIKTYFPLLYYKIIS